MSAVSILEDRAVIRVGGESATTFLQGLISQDMAALEAGPAFGALLAPQGKIAAEFIMTKDAEGYLLDCHASVAAALVKKLSLYRLRAPVVIEHREDMTVAAAAEPDSELSRSGFRHDPRLAALGVRAMLPRAAAAAFTRKTEGVYEARRIAQGVPELGRDFGPDEMFLLDVNADALNGVNYRKGCFVGQEVTSRMKRKGEIRKRTLIVRGTALSKGAPVTAEGTALGAVTSHRGETGLALIRVDRLAEARASNAALQCGGAPAALEAPAYLKDG